MQNLGILVSPKPSSNNSKNREKIGMSYKATIKPPCITKTIIKQFQKWREYQSIVKINAVIVTRKIPYTRERNKYHIPW